jgi:hypothetical protein
MTEEVDNTQQTEEQVEEYLNHACNLMCNIASQQAPYTMFVLGGENEEDGQFGIVMVAVGEDGRKVWEQVQAVFPVPEVSDIETAIDDLGDGVDLSKAVFPEDNDPED